MMGIVCMMGGGGTTDLDQITAEAGDVIAGKIIVDQEGNPVTGTLTLDGTAEASNVLAGTTFYNTDAKNKVTGTMANRGTYNATITSVNGSVTLPAGYYSGGKVSVNLSGSTYTCTFGTTKAASTYGQYQVGTEYKIPLPSITSQTSNFVSVSGSVITANTNIPASTLTFTLRCASYDASKTGTRDVTVKVYSNNTVRFTGTAKMNWRGELTTTLTASIPAMSKGQTIQISVYNKDGITITYNVGIDSMNWKWTY